MQPFSLRLCLLAVVLLTTTVVFASKPGAGFQKKELYPKIKPTKAVIYPSKAIVNAEAVISFPTPGSYVLVVTNWTSYAQGQRSELEENSLQARLEMMNPASSSESSEAVKEPADPQVVRPSRKGRYVDALVERLEWAYVPVVSTESLELQRLNAIVTTCIRRRAELSDNVTMIYSKQKTILRVKDALLGTLTQDKASTLATSPLGAAVTPTTLTFSAVQEALELNERKEAALMEELRNLNKELTGTEESLLRATASVKLISVQHHTVLRIHVGVAYAPGQYTLLLSGVVGRASWKPSYEVRLSSSHSRRGEDDGDYDDEEEKDAIHPPPHPSSRGKKKAGGSTFSSSPSTQVDVSYFAEVEHHFRIDWTDITLELSTGEPAVGNGAQRDVSPTLMPWILNPTRRFSEGGSGGFFSLSESMVFGIPARSSGHHSHQAMRGRTEALMDGAATPQKATESTHRQEAIFVEETAVSSNGISDTFALGGRHTLLQGQRGKILVELLPMPGNITRAAYPAVSTKVFLQATLLNTSPFTLLPGRSMLFLDDTFVGETLLSLLRLREYRTIDVGVDPGLTVKRHLLATERSNQEKTFLFFGKDEKVIVKKYLAVVHSQKKTVVRNLKVYDILPLVAGDGSGDKEINKKTTTLLRTPQYPTPIKSQKDLQQGKTTTARFLEIQGEGTLVGGASQGISTDSTVHTQKKNKKFFLRTKLFTESVLLSQALSGAVLLERGEADPFQSLDDGITRRLPIGTVEWTVAKLFPGDTMEIPFEFTIATLPDVYIQTIDD